jgi:hypothetical protein
MEDDWQYATCLGPKAWHLPLRLVNSSDRNERNT